MGYPTTPSEKINKIKYLRSRGYTIPEICQKTGVPKTTVFRYAQPVKILDKYVQIFTSKRGGTRRIKLEKEKKALKDAKKIINNLNYKEKLIFLSALYWGEGTKRDFSLTNTDPDLIRVFVHFTRDVLGISKEELRPSIRIYEDLDKEICLAFWASVIGIPKENFVNVNILPGKKKGKLKYGMCRLRISKGGDHLKRIVAVNKAIVQNLPL